MQADSESECQSWITAIQRGVSTAYNKNTSMDATVKHISSLNYCEISLLYSLFITMFVLFCL